MPFRRLGFGFVSLASAFGALAACSSFGASDSEGPGPLPNEDGAGGTDARGEAGDVDARVASDGATPRAFCQAYQGVPNAYCLDFDQMMAEDTPAPHAFGPFSTTPDRGDPRDRAEWSVVSMGTSAPNAGRLQVAAPDGGPALAASGAMNLSLATKPSRLTCRISWQVATRAPASGSGFPENFALLTLYYRDAANGDVRLSLVTNTVGETHLYQPGLPPGAQHKPLPGLEGIGWRRATVVFDLPAPGGSSFIQVSPGGGGPETQVPFALASEVKDLRVVIGPDAVSTHPWSVLFDDIVCTVVP